MLHEPAKGRLRARDAPRSGKAVNRIHYLKVLSQGIRAKAWQAIAIVIA